MYSEILLKDNGMMHFVNDVKIYKTPIPIWCMGKGSFISFNEVHSLKEPDWIEFIFVQSSIDCNDVQWQNASLQISCLLFWSKYNSWK